MAHARRQDGYGDTKMSIAALSEQMPTQHFEDAMQTVKGSNLMDREDA